MCGYLFSAFIQTCPAKLPIKQVRCRLLASVPLTLWCFGLLQYPLTQAAFIFGEILLLVICFSGFCSFLSWGHFCPFLAAFYSWLSCRRCCFSLNGRVCLCGAVRGILVFQLAAFGYNSRTMLAPIFGAVSSYSVYFSGCCNAAPGICLWSVTYCFSIGFAPCARRFGCTTICRWIALATPAAETGGFWRPQNRVPFNWLFLSGSWSPCWWQTCWRFSQNHTACCS